MTDQKLAVIPEVFTLPKDLAQRAEDAIALAEGFEVDSVDSRDMAIEMAQKNRAIKAEILNIVDPFVKDDHDKWKRSVARREDTA